MGTETVVRHQCFTSKHLDESSQATLSIKSTLRSILNEVRLLYRRTAGAFSMKMLVSYKCKTEPHKIFVR